MKKNIKNIELENKNSSEAVQILPESTFTQEQVEDQLQASEEKITKQKSKRKKILNLVMLVLNFVVVAGILCFQLLGGDVISFGSMLDTHFNVWFLIVCLLLHAITIIIESLQLLMLIKFSTKRARPFLSLKAQVVGRYYDAVTPLSSGGQPFQIMYMTNRGIPASSAVSVTMGKYVYGQLAWVIIGIIAVIYGFQKNILTDFAAIGTFCILGFIACFAVMTAVIVLSVSKKIGKRLAVALLKFLEKIKIVKNYEKQYTRVMKTVSDYQSIMTQFASSFWQFIKNLSLALVRNIIFYSIPYFIYCTIVGWDPSVWFQMAIISIIVDLASTIMPLPGGTGVNELSFTAIFASFFGKSVFWAMLIWRFLSFYLFIVEGIVFITYDYFIGNKKWKWTNKKWALEKESAQFKEEQIKNYKKNKNKQTKDKMSIKI
ncbi:MAG: lysylphosphatidylglycerol synthase transmembrane domain-containing protein [Clostridia bacterium]